MTKQEICSICRNKNCWCRSCQGVNNPCAAVKDKCCTFNEPDCWWYNKDLKNKEIEDQFKNNT